MGLTKVFEGIRKEFDDRKLLHVDGVNDDVLMKLGEVFEGKVGGAYEDDKLSSILEEGEDRYNNKVPPGYEDDNKNSNDLSIKYGDLILWKQVLDKAEEEQLGVIFITDDNKEDWWLKLEGKTIGPRIELLKEFATVNKKGMLMYNSSLFLKYAGEYFDRSLSDVAAAELEYLRKFDRDEQREKSLFSKRERELYKKQQEALLNDYEREEYRQQNREAMLSDHEREEYRQQQREAKLSELGREAMLSELSMEEYESMFRANQRE